MSLYLTDNLIGVPIYDVHDAEKLGEVSNIKVRLREGILDSYEFLESVPLEEPELTVTEVEKRYELDKDIVQSMSEDALLVHSKAHQDDELDMLTKQGVDVESIKGIQVLTTQEQDLGRITDLLIESQTQKIKGLQISDGFWRDLLGVGNQYIPFPQAYNVIDGTMIVPYDYEKRMVHHPLNITE